MDKSVFLPSLVCVVGHVGFKPTLPAVKAPFYVSLRLPGLHSGFLVGESCAASHWVGVLGESYKHKCQKTKGRSASGCSRARKNASWRGQGYWGCRRQRKRWRDVEECGGIQRDVGTCRRVEECGGRACTEPHIPVAMLSVGGRAIYLASRFSARQMRAHPGASCSSSGVLGGQGLGQRVMRSVYSWER